MKKLLAVLITAMLTLCAVCAPALAEEEPYADNGGEYADEGYAEELTLSGTLKPEREITVTAPFGGTVLGCDISAGDAVKAGDALFVLDTIKTYAPTDGVVSAVFVSEGEDLTGIVYEAPMWLEPSSPFVIKATTSGANNATDTKYIHAGERVYLSATGSDERRANGVVTSVNGTSYTVEVLDGNLRISENCNISRSDDPGDTKLRIGSGKTVRNNPVAITAEGSVVKLHVKQNDAVKKGDLLMETARGDLRGKGISGGEVLAAADGVITSVSASVGMSTQEGQAMLAMHARGALEAAVLVDEDDLSRLNVGDAVVVELDCASGEVRVEGVIRAIARAPGPDEKGVVYEARISFENDDFVRMGMSVTVRK